MSDIKVLAIIVTYNGKQWINRCFDSIKASQMPATIFVIDNKSTDDTLSIIKEQYPEAILYESDRNLGFGGANNIGMQYAIEHNYDYVYLLNQDAWVMPDTIKALIETHEKNPQYGVLSPLQTNAEMNRLDEYFAKSLSKNHNVLSDYILGETKDIYEVEFVMAAHWLITRECLERVGFFSPVFFHYGEDDNYLHRAIYHKFKVGVVPSVIGVHDREFREWSKAKDVHLVKQSFYIVASNINAGFIYSLLRAYAVLLTYLTHRAIKYRDPRIVFHIIPKLFTIGKIYRDRAANKRVKQNANK